MSLTLRNIAIAIMIAIAPLIFACGSESDAPNPSELEEMNEELEQRLIQADLKPVEQIDEDIRNTETE